MCFDVRCCCWPSAVFWQSYLQGPSASHRVSAMSDVPPDFYGNRAAPWLVWDEELDKFICKACSTDYVKKYADGLHHVTDKHKKNVTYHCRVKKLDVNMWVTNKDWSYSIRSPPPLPPSLDSSSSPSAHPQPSSSMDSSSSPSAHPPPPPPWNSSSSQWAPPPPPPLWDSSPSPAYVHRPAPVDLMTRLKNIEQKLARILEILEPTNMVDDISVASS